MILDFVVSSTDTKGTGKRRIDILDFIKILCALKKTKKKSKKTTVIQQQKDNSI